MQLVPEGRSSPVCRYSKPLLLLKRMKAWVDGQGCATCLFGVLRGLKDAAPYIRYGVTL